MRNTPAGARQSPSFFSLAPGGIRMQAADPRSCRICQDVRARDRGRVSTLPPAFLVKALRVTLVESHVVGDPDDALAGNLRGQLKSRDRAAAGRGRESMRSMAEASTPSGSPGARSGVIFAVAGQDRGRRSPEPEGFAGEVVGRIAGVDEGAEEGLLRLEVRPSRHGGLGPADQVAEIDVGGDVLVARTRPGFGAGDGLLVEVGAQAASAAGDDRVRSRGRRSRWSAGVRKFPLRKEGHRATRGNSRGSSITCPSGQRRSNWVLSGSSVAGTPFVVPIGKAGTARPSRLPSRVRKRRTGKASANSFE